MWVPDSTAPDEYFAHVSPSSLIFLVVIAVWAVYLTLHVIRRREHLVTARNVDRFSVHMRVLQRRAVRNAPRTRLKSSVTLVRAAQLGRAAASTVSVPMAVSEGSVATSALPHAPALGAPKAPASDDGHPSESQAEREVAATLTEPTDGSNAATEVSGPPYGQDLHIAPIRITWPFAVLGTLGSLPPRLMRAVALGASFAFAVLAAALAATGTIAAWLVLFGLAPLGVVVGWLPRSAKAERAAKVRQMRARRHARARTGSATAPAVATWQELPGRSRTPEMPVALEHVEVAPERRVSRTVRPPAAAAPASAAAGAATGATAAVRSSATRRSEPFDLLTADPSWSPVPVPPPTYTLKAQARRPMPQPIVGDVPIPIEVEDDFDNWGQARPSRRAVNG